MIGWEGTCIEGYKAMEGKRRERKINSRGGKEEVRDKDEGRTETELVGERQGKKDSRIEGRDDR